MKTDRIESYINGELTNDEIIQFEKELQNNPELQAEVKEMRFVIQQFETLRLSDKIKKAQQLNKRNQNFRNYLMIGATGMLVLLGTIYFMTRASKEEDLQNTTIAPAPDSIDKIQTTGVDTSNTKSPSSAIPNEPTIPPVEKDVLPRAEVKFDLTQGKEIAMNAYFEPKDLEFVRGTDLDNLLDSARMSYNNEEFATTLSYLNKMDGNTKLRDYFKAHVYFRTNQYSQAKLLYERILKQEKSIAKIQEIEWYLLLNDLACGIKCQKNFELQLVKIVQNPEHAYFKEVLALQKKIVKK